MDPPGNPCLFFMSTINHRPRHRPYDGGAAGGDADGRPSHRRPSPCAYASSAWASNLGDGDIRQRDKCDIHEASNDGHDGANSDRPNDRLPSVRECSHE